MGIEPAGYRERLTVRPPNAGEVTFFKLRDTAAVLVVVTQRTAYAEDRRPIRYTVTVYPADRNDFVIEFGNLPPMIDRVREF